MILGFPSDMGRPYIDQQNGRTYQMIRMTKGWLSVPCSDHIGFPRGERKS